MNVPRILVSVLGVLGFCATGQAQNFVWWEAVPLTPGSIVLDQGMGKALQLSCDPALQEGNPSCRWTVVMRLRNEVRLWGWATDLGALDDTVSILTFVYREPEFSEQGEFISFLPFDFTLSAEIGVGPDLLNHAGAGTLSLAPPSDNADDGIAWSIFEFTLSKQVTSFDSGLSEVFGRTGPKQYAGEFGVFLAFVGDNAEMEISPFDVRYPNPVITIEGPRGELWTPEASPGSASPWEPPAPEAPEEADPPEEAGPPEGPDEPDEPEDPEPPPRQPPGQGLPGGTVLGTPDPFLSLFSLCAPSGVTTLSLTLCGLVVLRRGLRRRSHPSRQA